MQRLFWGICGGLPDFRICDEDHPYEFPTCSSTAGGLADVLVRTFALMPAADAYRLMSEALSDPAVVTPGLLPAEELGSLAKAVWDAVPLSISEALRAALEFRAGDGAKNPLLGALYNMSDAVRRQDNSRQRALDAVEREDERKRGGDDEPRMVSANDVDDDDE